jgi:hypothetical protein
MHPHKERGVGTRILKSARRVSCCLARAVQYLSHGERRSCGRNTADDQAHRHSFLFSEVCLAHSRVSRRCVSNIYLVFTNYHCDGFPLGGNMHTTTCWTASTTCHYVDHHDSCSPADTLLPTKKARDNQNKI